ncbi:uncharacterized protein LOC113563390 [Ooceraea biroi]|uniref:uncharacterized protein LOC113563390 n=1 Tax=Ooceraea biroi TaxID=2015173 RepID=UPI000F090557|nr:uncharacterized protein LOC113563390 [Ooceraea biroi]
MSYSPQIVNVRVKNHDWLITNEEIASLSRDEQYMSRFLCSNCSSVFNLEHNLHYYLGIERDQPPKYNCPYFYKTKHPRTCALIVYYIVYIQATSSFIWWTYLHGGQDYNLAIFLNLPRLQFYLLDIRDSVSTDNSNVACTKYILQSENSENIL